MIKTYYKLTKPGIIFGNAVTAISGFLLASRGHVNPLLFLITLGGLSSIIASACVANNYRDRFIDAKMGRTKNRGLPTGSVSEKNALFFCVSLLFVGTLMLGLYTNPLTLSTALAGFLIYVFLYTPLKRKSVHATAVGGLAGAIPPVVGYCAVTNRFDTGALLLFSIVALWQMPHFFAIALYRLKDYASASIPVLPLKRGISTTKMQMLLYTVCFSAVTPMLTLTGYTGSWYLWVTSAFNLIWVYFCVQGFTKTDSILWAKTMFIFSVVVIMVLSCMVAIG